MLKRFAFFVLLALPCVLWSQEGKLPFYTIFIRVEPDMHQINCQFEVKYPTSSGFYLNGVLDISSLIVDGQPASFHEE